MQEPRVQFYAVDFSNPDDAGKDSQRDIFLAGGIVCSHVDAN